MSKTRLFTAPTQVEANRQADEWWAPQKGLCLIQRTQVAVGFGSSLAEKDQWAVTIHYEAENSN